MKKIKATLLDTTYNYTLVDVNDFLEANDCELAENDFNDSKYWDAVREMKDMDCEDFWDNLKYSKSFGKDSYSPCVILGSCGCWDGRHTIVPVKCNTLYGAISKCLDNMDDGIVEQNCSTINVTGLHHDGRNYFEIHLLNDRGVNAWERYNEGYGKADFSNRIYHKTLYDYVY